MTPRIHTFLFTDIEGSTSLVEAHADRHARALADHRRIMRRVCAQHSGDEVRTTGDGYFAEFADACDAVAAAIDAQISLRANPWPVGLELQVRMGLHTGEVEVDGGELVGFAVHEAARVCAAAHGGQIVMSGETRAAAGDTVDAVHLGVFSLRGVSTPVDLYQVRHPQLPQSFPPPNVGARRTPVRSTRHPRGDRRRPRDGAYRLPSHSRRDGRSARGGRGEQRV